MKYWLLALAFLLLIPNLFPYHLVSQSQVPGYKEDFDPKLTKKIQNLPELEAFVDSVIQAKGGTARITTELYADIISSTLRSRFFHGYSHYSLNENWLAALAGKFIWNDLSAIVIADDILKYPNAACSQQAIVLMEFFKRKQIKFRKIGFDHHFAVEGFINGEWIYFDPNLEPEFHGTHRSFEYLRQGKRLAEVYENILPEERIPIALGNPRYGNTNAYPAPRARMMHYTLETLSHSLWVFPVFLFGMNFWERRKRTA